MKAAYLSVIGASDRPSQALAAEVAIGWLARMYRLARMKQLRMEGEIRFGAAQTPDPSQSKTSLRSDVVGRNVKLDFLDGAVCDHRVSDFDEAGDVGTGDVINVVVGQGSSRTVLDALGVNVLHDAQKFFVDLFA